MAVGNASLGTIRGSIKIDYDGAGVARANRDLDTIGKKGKTSAASFNQAGTIMLAAGAAIAGGFALAVNSAANFEKGLSNIRAVSGATHGRVGPGSRWTVHRAAPVHGVADDPGSAPHARRP